MLQVVDTLRAMLVVALAIPAAASAGAEKVLQWKLQPGQTLRYQIVLDMNLQYGVDEGMTPMTVWSNKLTMDIAWTVDAVNDQGIIALTQKVSRIRMKWLYLIDLIALAQPEVMREYDSASGKEPEGLPLTSTPMFEAMLDKPIQMKITRCGEINEMKLPPGILESMNDIVGWLACSLVSGSGDLMRQMGVLNVLPEGPVAVGATWSRAITMKDPFFDGLPIETGYRHEGTDYRYEGTEIREGRPLEKTSLSMQFKPSRGVGDATTGSISQTGKGTTYFDAEAGLARETQTEIIIKSDNVRILCQLPRDDERAGQTAGGGQDHHAGRAAQTVACLPPPARIALGRGSRRGFAQGAGLPTPPA